MAEISLLRRRMIEGHDGPQSLAGDATIPRARGIDVQPVLRTLARHADAGGRADLPGASRREGCGVGEPEPDGGGAAVLLRRDPRPGGGPGADRLCPGAAPATGRCDVRPGEQDQFGAPWAARPRQCRRQDRWRGRFRWRRCWAPACTRRSRTGRGQRPDESRERRSGLTSESTARAVIAGAGPYGSTTSAWLAPSNTSSSTSSPASAAAAA